MPKTSFGISKEPLTSAKPSGAGLSLEDGNPWEPLTGYEGSSVPVAKTRTGRSRLVVPIKDGKRRNARKGLLPIAGRVSLLAKARTERSEFAIRDPI